nr:immunoglobulin heavy chain junction region [Mus musculus]NSM04579.1 immunoglobulin heavy chain junction region [Mus musculus]NSM04665.1 immunoglobulin heavy chain junction region [Mus musculus]NSM04888.1 immunoglobulin heavy chain junction region [Mus musculus]NSM05277.1 immunoglobulin heavy chain junction region [Mus musculus]
CASPINYEGFDYW